MGVVSVAGLNGSGAFRITIEWSRAATTVRQTCNGSREENCSRSLTFPNSFSLLSSFFFLLLSFGRVTMGRRLLIARLELFNPRIA